VEPDGDVGEGVPVGEGVGPGAMTQTNHQVSPVPWSTAQPILVNEPSVSIAQCAGLSRHCSAALRVGSA
jgi:hypothetical protein